MAVDKVSRWTGKRAMAGEYSAELGDARLTERAKQVGGALTRRPEESFPRVFPDEAGLEGFYRLVANDAAGWRDLMAPHVQRTVDRAVEAADVAVVHDTTDVTLKMYWSGEMRGQMSRFASRSQGFFAHTSLAVTAQGPALPLGTLDVQPFVHQSGVDAEDRETWEFWDHECGLFSNEQARWYRAVALTDETLAARGVRPVHLMDCESDSFGLLAALAGEGYRFVVRSDGQRKLKPIGEMSEVGTLNARLGARFDLRDAKKKSAHPSRRARLALLTVRAGVVRLQRAAKAKDASWSPDGPESQPKTLDLHLVEAVELHPPAGEKPVRWLLLTREPVDTPQQAMCVVDLYRRRWLVEEFFFALKTGCKLEARQMQTAAGMLKVLALLLPAAWRLLLMRSLAAEHPDAAWAAVLTPLEFTLLRRAVPKAKLDKRNATVEKCLYAIAKLGGHLPRNGPPGWRTLNHGWDELQKYVAGARMGRDAIND